MNVSVLLRRCRPVLLGLALVLGAIAFTASVRADGPATVPGVASTTQPATVAPDAQRATQPAAAVDPRAGSAAPSGDTGVAINTVWTLVAGFLVIFMQARFALVETGLCRAKNAAHVMSMNFLVYALG